MSQPLRIGSVPSVADIEFIERVGTGLGAGRFKARLGDRRETASLLIVPGDREERTRAGRWARRLAEVDHPGVPRMQRIEEVAEPAFIALDYVEGTNLEARMALSGKPLSESAALSVTLQAAAALQTAHKRQVAHGALTARSVILLPRPGAMEAVRLVGWTPPARHVRFEKYARDDVRGLGGLLYAAITGAQPPSMTPAPHLPLPADDEGGGGAFDGVLMDWVEVDRDVGAVGRIAMAAMADDGPFHTIDQLIAELRPHFRARVQHAITRLDESLENDAEFVREVERKRADHRQLEGKLRLVREWLREHEAEINRVDEGAMGLKSRRRSLQNAEVELEMLLEGVAGAFAASLPVEPAAPPPVPRVPTPAPPPQSAPEPPSLPPAPPLETAPRSEAPLAVPAVDLLLESSEDPTEAAPDFDPRIVRPQDRMKAGGGRLIGVLSAAVFVGVALAAWIVVSLSDTPPAPAPPPAQPLEVAEPAPEPPPPLEPPPVAPEEIAPRPGPIEAAELEPEPVRAPEPPPPPAGMVAIRAGTLLPGLAEAQLAFAGTQCQQDFQRHPEHAPTCATKFDGEPPRGPVKMSAFYIDRFEVSQRAWAECRAKGPCTRLLLHWDLKEQPATGVTHHMAAKYCEWRGARLPNEDEWLFAARGHADPRLYPWGDAPPIEEDRHKANYGRMGSKRGIPNRKDGHKYAAPIGVFQERGASPMGVANMGGNVREWTATKAGVHYVARGGGWKDIPHDLRVTRRQLLPPRHSENDLGFRCVKDLED